MYFPCTFHHLVSFGCTTTHVHMQRVIRMLLFYHVRTVYCLCPFNECNCIQTSRTLYVTQCRWFVCVENGPIFHIQKFYVENGPFFHIQKFHVENGPFFHIQKFPVENGPFFHIQKFNVENGPFFHIWIFARFWSLASRNNTILDCENWGISSSELGLRNFLLRTLGAEFCASHLGPKLLSPHFGCGISRSTFLM